MFELDEEDEPTSVVVAANGGGGGGEDNPLVARARARVGLARRGVDRLSRSGARLVSDLHGGGRRGSDDAPPDCETRRHYEEEVSDTRGGGALTRDERASLVARSDSLTRSVLRALRDPSLWTEVNEQDGVRVWRTDVDVKNLVGDGDEGRDRGRCDFTTDAACAESTAVDDAVTVRSEAVLDASPSAVYQLLHDDDRVHEYNDNCNDIRDLERVSRNSKINWSATRRFGPFSARDFVTLVTYRELDPVDEEGYLHMAVSVNHPRLAPPTSRYVRSNIQLAATFLRPVPGRPDLTKMVQVMQVGSLGGVADSPMAQRIKTNLELKAPVDFARKVNAALLRGVDTKENDKVTSTTM